MESSLACVNTALNPNLKDEKGRLAFRVPLITHRWTSSPLYILDGYKTSLVFSKVDDTKSDKSRCRSTTASSSTTSVSLELMRGEKDDQLMWPTDSSLTLKMFVKSESSASRAFSTPVKPMVYRPSWQESEEAIASCASDDDEQRSRPLTLSLKLNHNPLLIKLCHSDNSRELLHSTIQFNGPWMVEITLSKPEPESHHRYSHGDYNNPHEHYYQPQDYSVTYGRDFYD